MSGSSKSYSPAFQVPALQQLWHAVTCDPMDFQSWTVLLSQVETVGSIGDAHSAYDGFLRHFPLCYGYWNKYAALARRHAAHATHPETSQKATNPVSPQSAEDARVKGDVNAAHARAREIFERAVSAAPFCLDLWEAFLADVMRGTGRKEAGDEGRVEGARRVYQRALEAVGDNPGAGRLWRQCVAFEDAQGGQERRITRLYETALSHRLRDLELLWVNFKEFTDRTPWNKLAPSPSSGVDEIGVGGSSGVGAASADDGREAGAVTVTMAAAAVSNGASDAERKAWFVNSMEEIRKVSLRGRERRVSFERRITRPYFHVKPLDDAQLSAWSEFLDFEQAQVETGQEQRGLRGRRSPVRGVDNASESKPAPSSAGKKRQRKDGVATEGGVFAAGQEGGCTGDVERLFERCLVPCASYWWLWERYALWKESVWGVESALEVVERACSPYLQWRPEALFFRAELLERVGRTDEARGVYRRVLSEVAPGLVEAACKLACFERRCGDRKAASAAYRSLLPPPLGGGVGGGQDGTPDWEETTETTRPYLYMQLARFQQRIVGDAAAARTTFRAAVADIPGSRELWLAFLEFEAAQPQALHAGRVEAAFRMAVERGSVDEGGDEHSEEARRLTVEDRADLWEWFEEFVEDLSMDVAKVMSVRAEHRAWTQANGATAHEATAATAAAAGDLRDKSNSDVHLTTITATTAAATSSSSALASSSGNGSARDRPSLRALPVSEVGVRTGAGGRGVIEGGGHSGTGWTASGDVGAAATPAAIQAFAETTREQWSAYFQQQQQHQQQAAQQQQQHLTAGGGAGAGVHAVPGAPATMSSLPYHPTYHPPAHGFVGQPHGMHAGGSGGQGGQHQHHHIQNHLQHHYQQQSHHALQSPQQMQLHQQIYGGGYPPHPPSGNG